MTTANTYVHINVVIGGEMTTKMWQFSERFGVSIPECLRSAGSQAMEEIRLSARKGEAMTLKICLPYRAKDSEAGAL